MKSLALALVVGAVVTACSPEGLTREGEQVGLAELQANNIGDPSLAAKVEADLTCLYSKAGLLPNEASSLGKFRTVVSSIMAGDLAGAQDDAAKLIAFIELKYKQYSNQAGSVDCGAPLGEIGITALKERVVARINAYVTLGGNVCEIPSEDPNAPPGSGSPATFCRTADNQTAIVYFPPEIFSQLTYVSVEENPPGFTRLQNLGFDEYPTYVRIVTEGISDFRGFGLKPLVYVCFTTQEQQDLYLLDRLRLGHRHTKSDGSVTFKLLPTPNYSDYNIPAVNVQDSVSNFCGGSTTARANGLAPFEGTNLLARIGNRVANFLAPAPLQASLLLAGRGGIGGSAEEFSEFGAVDRGIAGTGGVGGSAEEFSRAEGLASAVVSDDGNTVTGKVGVDNNVTNPTELPRVRVTSPASGAPIESVKVYFQLLTSSQEPASQASFCGVSALVVEVMTNANGEASPPCLNFGNTIGFKKLKVTFDPTPVDVEACIIDDNGDCDPTSARNFLLATVSGDPAKLAVVNVPSTTAAVDVPMAIQPVLQVQDAGGNAVTNLPSDVAVEVSVTKADAGFTAGGSVSTFSSTTNRALGQITLSGLALGGKVGTAYRVAFASGVLGAAFDTVTITAPGAAADLAVGPPTATAQAGGLISTITATVSDAYGNGVPDVNVTVASSGLGCFSDPLATTCTTATTGPAGTASFSDLAVRGPGLSRTLTFNTTPVTGTKTVALTLTAGAPSKILANNSFAAVYSVGAALSPAVTVTDAYDNPVANASVLWQLQGTTNPATVAPSGATISAASTSTVTNGTTDISWRLGDGDNGLRAYLGSTAAGSAYAQFVAASQTGGVTLECIAGSRTRKIDLASYDASRNGYVGTFSMQPELGARFRSLRLFMSITGQASGTGDYPAVVKVYRGNSKTPANLIAESVPGSIIQLDGNNGNAAPVDFILMPPVANPSASVAPDGNSNFVLIEVAVTAPSTRTLQIWYNQPAGGGTCGSTFLYAPGVTDFQNAPSRSKTPGVLIRVRN